MTDQNSQFEAELAQAQAAEDTAAVTTEGDAGTQGTTAVAPDAQPAATPAPESGVDARFSELSAQKNAAREEARLNAERASLAEQRARLFEQELANMRAAMAQQFPQQDPIAEVAAQFEHPDERALATVVAKVVGRMAAPLERRLQKFESVAEDNEATRFWSSGGPAKQPPAVKERTEQFYQQYRHTGINRMTALKQVLGDMVLEDGPFIPQQQAAVTQQVAQQNATARTITAASPATAPRGKAPTFDPQKATAAQLWEYLKKHGDPSGS